MFRIAGSPHPRQLPRELIFPELPPYYDFARIPRIHRSVRSVRVTPALEAGAADHVWTAQALYCGCQGSPLDPSME